jgi:hypothetical protein
MCDLVDNTALLLVRLRSEMAESDQLWLISTAECCAIDNRGGGDYREGTLRRAHL